MTTIVRHPNRHIDARSAAVTALTRWFPSETVLRVAHLRDQFPRWPLIMGGSPRPTSPGGPAPDDNGGAGRACA